MSSGVVAEGIEQVSVPKVDPVEDAERDGRGAGHADGS